MSENDSSGYVYMPTPKQGAGKTTYDQCTGPDPKLNASNNAAIDRTHAGDEVFAKGTIDLADLGSLRMPRRRMTRMQCLPWRASQGGLD